MIELTKTLKIRLNEDTLFYLMVCLIALHQALSATDVFFSYIEKDLLLIIPITILAVLQVARIHSVSREQIVLLFFIIISVYTASVTGSSWLVFFFVVSFFMKGKDIDKFIKSFIVPTATVFFINYAIFVFSYIKNSEFLEFIVQNGDKRYFLFYNSPNAPSRILIFLVLGYFYLKRNNISLIDKFITFIVFVITYFFTRSDALFLILLIVFFFGIKKRIAHILVFLPKCIYLVELIISFVYPFFSQNILFSMLNKFLVGRLSTSLQTFKIYGLTWFGQSAELGFQEAGGIMYKLLCDNGFYHIIIKYGVVYLGLITIIMMVKKVVNVEESICYTIFVLYMFLENQVFDFPVVFPLLIMVWNCVNKQEIKNVLHKERVTLYPKSSSANSFKVTD